jgi:hypothetical protein
MSNETMKQIIPSSGWVSVRKEEDGRIFKQAIVCWALIHEEENEETHDYIVPMVADLNGVTEPLGPDEIVYNENNEGYISLEDVPTHLQRDL